MENDCSWIRALPVPPNEGEKPVSHGVPQDRLRSEDLSERWETGFSYLVLRTGIEPVPLSEGHFRRNVCIYLFC